MIGQLLIISLLVGIPVCSHLRVTTVPPALDVWVDGSFHGVSPLLVDSLAPGHHLLRVASRGEWWRQPLDTLVYLNPGLAEVTLRTPGTLHIVTSKSGATILENDRIIGQSPLVLSREASRATRLTVRVSGMRPYDWDWIPAAGSLTSTHVDLLPLEGSGTAPGRRSRGAAITGIASAAMAAVSAILAHEADRAYEEYEDTANPRRIRMLFDRAQRLDRWASGLWSGFQVGAATAVIWWILG